MKTEEVLKLDYRDDKNKKAIQKVLRQIKPLSKCDSAEDVPQKSIERAIGVMSCNYEMYVRALWMDPVSNPKHLIWRAAIVNDLDMSTIDLVYGIELYEVLAKIAIRMYAEVRNGIARRGGGEK